MTLPWDINEARFNLHAASAQQQSHQERQREAVRAAARAEQVYRVARARRTAELRDQGHAASLCDTLARGDEQIAMLRRAADEADGDREIAIQEGWRLHANRRDVEQLAQWSMRRELAEHGGDDPRLHWAGREASA